MGKRFGPHIPFHLADFPRADVCSSHLPNPILNQITQMGGMQNYTPSKWKPFAFLFVLDPHSGTCASEWLELPLSDRVCLTPTFIKCGKSTLQMCCFSADIWEAAGYLCSVSVKHQREYQLLLAGGRAPAGLWLCCGAAPWLPMLKTSDVLILVRKILNAKLWVATGRHSKCIGADESQPHSGFQFCHQFVFCWCSFK